MKAVISKVFEDGSTRPGSEGNSVTKEYSSFRTLYRYAIRPALYGWCEGRARVEIYNGNIYGKPIKVISYNNHLVEKVI